MKHSDLKFKRRTDGIGGTHATVFFDNGYGASVIEGGTMAYGGRELAVLKGKEGDWGLCYDTPITDDVIGHCSKGDITSLLKKIEALSGCTASKEV